MKGVQPFLLSACLLASAMAPADLLGQVRAGAAYLKILPGTRQQSLGNSLAGSLDGTYSLYSNPGATGLLREWQLAAGYNKWIADIQNISVLGARQFGIKTPFGDRLALALGLNYQGVADFDATRGTNTSVSAQDFLIAAGVGLPVDRISRYLSLGLNAKYLKTDLAQYSSSAFMIDVGLIQRTPRVSLPALFDYVILSGGVSLNHIGQSMEFISNTTPLPRTLRAGLALNLGTHDGLQLQVIGDYSKIRDEDGKFIFGIESVNVLNAMSSILGLENNLLGRLIQVRGGYNFTSNHDTRLVSKYSIGASIRLDDYMNSYARSTAWMKNKSLRFDLGLLESASFSNVTQIGTTLRPIGPESFGFSLTDRMSYDIVPVPAPYKPGEHIILQWKRSYDPDLYDDIQYLNLVAKDDADGLSTLFELIEARQVNLSDFARPPKRVEVGRGLRPDQLYLFIQDAGGRFVGASSFTAMSSNEIIVFSVDDPDHQVKVELDASHWDGPDTESCYFFDKTGRLIAKVHLAAKTMLPADSTRMVITHRLEEGDYYWSTIAFDMNHHTRLMESDGFNIGHFLVEEDIRPDLTINIAPFDSTFPLSVFRPGVDGLRFGIDIDALDLSNDRMAAVLSRWEAVIRSQPDIRFRVAGFADTTGGSMSLVQRKRYNQDLSQRRADNATAYLIARGIPESQLASIGYGESRSAADLNYNRRVELQVAEDNRPPAIATWAEITFANLDTLEGLENVEQAFTVSVYQLAEEHAIRVNGATEGFTVNLGNGSADDSLFTEPVLIPGEITSSRPIFSELQTPRTVPDTLRIDTMAPSARAVNKLNLARMAAGADSVITVPWDKEKPYMLAVVDIESHIAERNERNNWDLATLAADLKLEVCRDELVVQDTDTVTYTLTVVNNGPATSRGFRIVNPVPKHLRPIGEQPGGDKLTWEIREPLEAGRQMSVSFSAVVESDQGWDATIAILDEAEVISSTDLNPANNRSSAKVYSSIISFEINKTAITPVSDSLLSMITPDLAAAIANNPNVVFEIGGHTDTNGSDEHNQNLSDLRATSVRDFFISHGVPAASLVAKGYGERFPRFPENERGIQRRNRRIEIKPLGTLSCSDAVSPE
jgi:uncharacterized repeat protein (TIGR01451 family)